jgi:predicted ATPase
MPEQARVKSVEAIELFRSQLIVYLSKARPTVEEVGAEISRARGWLQEDRKQYWESQLRRRLKLLEQAQETLSTAKMANLRSVTTAEQQAVRAAERAVREAEEKLKLVKKWSRDFDSTVVPLGRQLEKLTTLLTTALPKAVLELNQTIKVLHDYSAVLPGSRPEAGRVAAATTPEPATPEEKR